MRSRSPESLKTPRFGKAGVGVGWLRSPPPGHWNRVNIGSSQGRINLRGKADCPRAQGILSVLFRAPQGGLSRERRGDKGVFYTLITVL